MLRIALTLLATALVCGAAENNAARVPVLLELFTSEGCSSCPPADRLLEALDQKQPVAGAHLIVLSEHVDYWDRFGWRDPFSSADYTARQQDYTNRYNLDGVYTPQLVIDGRFGVVGSDERLAYSAIQKSIQEKKIPMAVSRAELKGSRVTARVEVQVADRSFRGARGVLYVALADNRQESHVARGENAGRSLAHVAVMRVLRPLGTVNLDHPSAKEVTLPADPESGSYGYRIVAFIQDPKSGHILGIAEQKF